MPLFDNEGELVAFIQKKIQGIFFKDVMESKRRPGQSFNNFLQKWWPNINLLAGREVDLILVTSKHELVAVEVKYSTKNKKISFSEGLDQALSYLLFGFHFVAFLRTRDGLGCCIHEE